ncbi:MAG: GGDEF domain-containing protein [Geminicoccaceae bacterium]|nr:MAG: GGDEF domain-containing protein [Geminicoccaceae bacterium]
MNDEFQPALSDDDLVALTGVPKAALTEEVRKALLTLLHDNADLNAEIERRRVREAELERLADEDSLVPISNRRSFMRELARSIRGLERYGTPGCVLYFDLNDLKHVNDRHGHAAGDAVLRHVAETLVRNLRASDVFARLGGDEFGVILMWADLETARQKARTLADLVKRRPLAWEGELIEVVLAYGAYAFAPGQPAEEVLHAADAEMYRCKRAQKAASEAAAPVRQ